MQSRRLLPRAWLTAAAILPSAALASACAPAPPKSPCVGLTYSDAGLTREQYAPCAKAMVGELDRMHEAVKVLGDASLPKETRLKAKGACFAAGGTLTRYMNEAGGTSKLVTMAWADRGLSFFNYDVLAARDAYTMYCYYGLTGPDVVRMDSAHADARRFANGLP